MFTLLKYLRGVLRLFKISLETTMETLTILAASNLFWFLPSTILFILIHKYIQKKAPAWQSIIDLLLLDTLKVKILQNCFSVLIYSGIFYQRLNPIVAQIMLGMTTSSLVLVLIMQEIMLILKALIIFKPGILTDQPDQKVIRLFRQSSFFCCCAVFILDYLLQANRPCCSLTLEYLTNTRRIS